MRPISKVFLARLATAAITKAACKGHGRRWTDWECAHAAAGDSGQAELAAAPAMVMCAGCPETVRCAERAELDRYSGRAAGAAYLNGDRRQTAAVVRKPLPSPQPDLTGAEHPGEAGQLGVEGVRELLDQGLLVIKGDSRFSPAA